MSVRISVRFQDRDAIGVGEYDADPQEVDMPMDEFIERIVKPLTTMGMAMWRRKKAE